MKQEIPGINKKIGKGIISGVVVFIAIILANFVIPGIGTIGVPSVTQAISNEIYKFSIIVIIAPIIETAFFFGIVLFLFYRKFNIPFIISAILTAVAFSLFHINAYGDFASSNADFILAGVMGLVFAYQTKISKSIIPATVTHILINLWIGFLIASIVL